MKRLLLQPRTELPGTRARRGGNGAAVFQSTLSSWLFPALLGIGFLLIAQQVLEAASSVRGYLNTIGPAPLRLQPTAPLPSDRVAQEDILDGLLELGEWQGPEIPVDMRLKNGSTTNSSPDRQGPIVGVPENSKSALSNSVGASVSDVGAITNLNQQSISPTTPASAGMSSNSVVGSNQLPDPSAVIQPLTQDPDLVSARGLVKYFTQPGTGKGNAVMVAPFGFVPPQSATPSTSRAIYTTNPSP